QNPNAQVVANLAIHKELRVNAPVVLRRVSSNHNPERHSLGLMDRQYSHCQAHMWVLERVGSSISILLLSPTPTEIGQLLCGNDTASKNFRSNIRAYNNALSFASLGASIDHTVANSHGSAYNFRIYGERQLEIRRNHTNASIDMEVLNTLQTLMHCICPFAHVFNNMATHLRDEDVNDVTLVICAEGTPDQRRYNRPTGDEVGLLIVDGSYEGQSGDRDIVVQTRSNQIQRISVNHRFYDAIHYVLMFPQGDEGWNIGAQCIDGSRVTCMDWYKYQLMIRSNNDNIEGQNDLHRFGELFQQYITDMYAKVESERLNYIRSNQDKLCSDLYKSVADAVNLGDNDMANVGKRVILPLSFIGGPRHCRMAHVNPSSQIIQI
ncbi:hypothetical protein INT45_004465, partial [Circinella minor]